MGWTLKNLGSNGAFHLPTHHQPRLRDKRKQVMCVQMSIEIIFIKVKKQHIGIKLSITSGVATVGTRGESPPSFCNGLGTIYIASFPRKDLWSYYQSMGSEFRYALRKVLGTQDRPTLISASHHCVLILTLLKTNLWRVKMNWPLAIN